MSLTAINPKNQSMVNKALRYDKRYNELNDLRDKAGDNGDEKAHRKYDRMCVDVFDKYLDAYRPLPKNQQKAIDIYLEKQL